jgi:hypothetical protein
MLIGSYRSFPRVTPPSDPGLQACWRNIPDDLDHSGECENFRLLDRLLTQPERIMRAIGHS